MPNFTILNGKIITSKYTLDMVNFIQKSKNESESKKVLLSEFKKLVLQGKVTFLYLYCDNVENRLRGRVRASAGFRTGTQRKSLMPDNKWPKSRSKNRTALRYYDFNRENWRSFRLDSFIVATSFWDDKNKLWKDDPYDAGFTSDWSKIVGLNNIKDHKQSNRPDTKQELNKRTKVAKQEQEKRNRQIANTKNKLKKSFTIEGGIIRL